MPYIVYGKKGRNVRYTSSGKTKKLIHGTKKEAEQVKNKVKERIKRLRTWKGWQVKVKKL